MAIAKEQLRQIIAENEINDVGDIYALFKEIFKDMLQEFLEAEMEASIGYPKNEKEEISIDNKRNGYSSKTVNPNMVNFRLMCLETEMENLNQNLLKNIKEIFQVLKRRLFLFMQEE